MAIKNNKSSLDPASEKILNDAMTGKTYKVEKEININIDMTKMILIAFALIGIWEAYVFFTS